jgi:hypothetical protein
MKKAYLTALVWVLASVAPVTAQMIQQAEAQAIRNDYSELRPVSKPFSLIDLSRVKWSHSYSVTFFSGGSSSDLMAMYTGSLFYEVSSSLSVNFALGIVHNPEVFFNSSVQSGAAFYPAFNVDYHPSDHFRISVGFISHPGFYNEPYGPFDRYSWRRY